MSNYLWLLPLFPLLGSAICGALRFATLRARKENPEANGPSALAALVGSGAVAASLVVSIIAFFQLMGETHALESTAWHWIDAGKIFAGEHAGNPFTIQLSMVVDRLSSVMLLVITGVGEFTLFNTCDFNR